MAMCCVGTIDGLVRTISEVYVQGVATARQAGGPRTGSVSVEAVNLPLVDGRETEKPAPVLRALERRVSLNRSGPEPLRSQAPRLYQVSVAVLVCFQL
jgi:hypothetical protein